MGAIAAEHDQFGEHRIVIHAHLAAGRYAGVDANTRSLRRLPARDAAGRRQQVIGGIFGINACFNGPAARTNVHLRDRKRFAVCDAQLPLHQIDAIDQFGHRMLDLQARVHLEEVVLAVAVEHELAGTRVHIADRGRGAYGSRAHLSAQFRREGNRWGFLDDLLMTTLDRTFAFTQMNRRPVRVGKNLKFDVSRIEQIAFQEHGVVAERRQRFAFGCGERLVKGLERVDDPHPAPAAAGAGFNEQRKTNRRSFLAQARGRLILAVVAGHGRHVRRAHAMFGIDLAAHCGHRIRRRANEDQPGIDAGLRKGRAFGEKAIAGMHCVGLHVDRCRDHGVNVEIRFGGRSGTDAARVVHELQVVGAGIGLRIDPKRSDIHLARRARDPHGDLTAVRDQKTSNHASLSAAKVAGRRSRNARSPSCPSSLVRCLAIAAAVMSRVSS